MASQQSRVETQYRATKSTSWVRQRANRFPSGHRERHLFSHKPGRFRCTQVLTARSSRGTHNSWRACRSGNCRSQLSRMSVRGTPSSSLRVRQWKMGSHVSRGSSDTRLSRPMIEAANLRTYSVAGSSTTMRVSPPRSRRGLRFPGSITAVMSNQVRFSRGRASSRDHCRVPMLETTRGCTMKHCIAGSDPHVHASQSWPCVAYSTVFRLAPIRS